MLNHCTYLLAVLAMNVFIVQRFVVFSDLDPMALIHEHDL